VLRTVVNKETGQRAFMGRVQNGHEVGRVLNSHLAVHSLPPADSTDLQRHSTDGWNGKTMQRLSPVVDTVSRRRGRMPCMRRMAEEAKAGGNAPDTLTSAR